MVYENGKPSNTYDIDNGTLEPREVEITHTWISSGWITTGPGGEVVEGYDGPLPDDPEASPVSEMWVCYDYRPYTQAERDALDACDRANAERREWGEQAPAIDNDHDAAIVALYEGMMQMQLETDEILTALYERTL